jgi:hypothetical protein
MEYTKYGLTFYNNMTAQFISLYFIKRINNIDCYKLEVSFDVSDMLRKDAQALYSGLLKWCDSRNHGFGMTDEIASPLTGEYRVILEKTKGQNETK